MLSFYFLEKKLWCKIFLLNPCYENFLFYMNINFSTLPLSEESFFIFLSI